MILVLNDLLPWLSVRQLNGSAWWLTLEDCEVRIAVDSRPCVITIPAGYRYNRASIPECVPSWIVSRDDLGCVAPLIHDALYNAGGEFLGQWNPAGWEPCVTPWRKFSRTEADQIFYALMIVDKVKPWRAELAYQVVRTFGRRW